MNIVSMSIGIVIIILGLLFNKQFHEKNFTEAYSSGSTSTSVNDSIIGGILYIIIGFFVSIMPWYIIKTLIILIGIIIVILSLRYI